MPKIRVLVVDDHTLFRQGIVGPTLQHRLCAWCEFRCRRIEIRRGFDLAAVSIPPGTTLTGV